MKKIKNERGVTMISLVVIILVTLILFVVTFSTATELVDSTKSKKYATIMYLIQGEITAIQDEVNLLENTDSYEGTPTNLSTNTKLKSFIDTILKNEVSVTDYNLYYNSSTSASYDEILNAWYKLNKSNLNRLGIETDIADNENKVFYVNYITGEIIYSEGLKVTIVNSEGKEERIEVYTLRTFESL